jgi:hypothetical protein
MKDQNELFIVEHENGEWVDNTGDGGWSCWTTRAEAQDALDSEVDNYEVAAPVEFAIVRFVREEQAERELITDLVKAEMRTINHFSLGGKSPEQERQYSLLEKWLTRG